VVTAARERGQAQEKSVGKAAHAADIALIPTFGDGNKFQVQAACHANRTYWNGRHRPAGILRRHGKDPMAAPSKRSGTAVTRSRAVSVDYVRMLEEATRGLLALNVSALERMEKRIGLAPLRGLQSLDRLGPSLVTELGDDLGLLSSTASRLSDRLAEAGYITRRVSPANRRATLLELTDAGRAVLDELVALRLHDFGEVAKQMSESDRSALLRGARAFTDAHRQLSDRTRQGPNAAGTARRQSGTPT
jgi:DNA-binding MarR family transcriptional regulator